VTIQSHNKDVVVIGLGNELMSDEGVGIHLIRQLSKLADKFPSVEFIEAGSAGMNLLHLIANRKKAIIIDCAKMGEKPGEMRRFTPQEAQSVKKLSNFSLHEADILQVINLSKQLGECPAEVVFFGIEPETIEPGSKLSETLSNKIESNAVIIQNELF
jgi:hydrogenase maturation protease